MKTTRVRKVPIKSIKQHSNFAEEIYQSEKTDKFLDRVFRVTVIILGILAIALIIANK